MPLAGCCANAPFMLPTRQCLGLPLTGFKAPGSAKHCRSLIFVSYMYTPISASSLSMRLAMGLRMGVITISPITSRHPGLHSQA